MSEKKTTLPSLRSYDWKKVKVETEKINKLLSNIPTGDIIELNELIYAGARLVCKRIGILLRNLKRNTKPGWEIRLEGQIKKLRPQAEILRKEIHEDMLG